MALSLPPSSDTASSSVTAKGQLWHSFYCAHHKGATVALQPRPRSLRTPAEALALPTTCRLTWSTLPDCWSHRRWLPHSCLEGQVDNLNWGRAESPWNHLWPVRVREPADKLLSLPHDRQCPEVAFLFAYPESCWLSIGHGFCVMWPAQSVTYHPAFSPTLSLLTSLFPSLFHTGLEPSALSHALFCIVLMPKVRGLGRILLFRN